MTLKAIILTLVLAGAAALVVRPAGATFPAANGLIAFAALDNNGDYQIFTVDQYGRGMRQLTHIPGGTYFPHWSPDGRRIVFEDDHTRNCPNVAIMNADGSRIVVIPDPPRVCQAMPSFTPDGTHIVFEHCLGCGKRPPYPGTDAVWIMRQDGSNAHQISAGSNDGICGAPEVSPDGTRVAFASCGPGPFDNALFTSRLDGGNLTQLTPFSDNVGGKEDWAPDGQRLLFVEDSDYPPGLSANLDTINPDGTGLFHVTHFTGGAGVEGGLTGSYSPDGQWIVFRYEYHGSYGLYKIHPDGTGMEAILPLSSFKPRAADWGPAVH